MLKSKGTYVFKNTQFLSVLIFCAREWGLSYYFDLGDLVLTESYEYVVVRRKVRTAVNQGRIMW